MYTHVHVLVCVYVLVHTFRYTHTYLRVHVSVCLCELLLGRSGSLLILSHTCTHTTGGAVQQS